MELTDRPERRHPPQLTDLGPGRSSRPGSSSSCCWLPALVPHRGDRLRDDRLLDPDRAQPDLLRRLTLNLLTLMGLALGFGLIVDNSIVVLENIYRKLAGGGGARDGRREGGPRRGAPDPGVDGTTLIVFVPFVYLQGELADLLRAAGDRGGAHAPGFDLRGVHVHSRAHGPAPAPGRWRGWRGAGGVGGLEGAPTGTTRDAARHTASAFAGIARPLHPLLLGAPRSHAALPLAGHGPSPRLPSESYHLFDKHVTAGDLGRGWGQRSYIERPHHAAPGLGPGADRRADPLLRGPARGDARGPGAFRPT
jgi:hypothetical protein